MPMTGDKHAINNRSVYFGLHIVRTDFPKTIFFQNIMISFAVGMETYAFP